MPPHQEVPRHRHRAQAGPRPGLRHVATAAAVASGTLAVVTPVTGLDLGPTPADLRLAAQEVSDGTDPGAPFAEAAAAARDTPVLGAEIVRDAGLLDPAADASLAAARKAQGLAQEAAERARAAAELAARGLNDPSCGLDLGDLGRVKEWVSDAADFLGCTYGETDLIGVAQRANASDHPTGHALDIMVRGQKGDRIADCTLTNGDELGVKYVIWEQRMNDGSGWSKMEDRGDDTANHYDHVHISFDERAGSGEPDLGRCA
ncbi:hypothetical protein [Pseudonocardia sp. HH130629-09]|uniref:hypothetical protein n=1 Tax=Pseudonocardia sp. HH130629-09 TaxID=1641402 RepID=UPI000A7B7237|nr:hypothetical protein [Pseudonocardia sp. HH130629-09]